MILSKEAIIQVDDLPKELVDVPEWGGSVYIRTMTGAERDAFEAAVYHIDDKGKVQAKREKYRAELCGRTIVDEDGNRLFSDAEVTALAGKSAAALDRIVKVANKLNGLGAKGEEEAEKN